MDDILGKIQTDLEACRGDLPAIAYRAGISYSTLVHILRGEMKSPRYGTIVALRRALDDYQAQAGASA